MNISDFKNIDSGKVIYWDMDSLDISIDPINQLDYLDEDLAQIEFGDHILLDIGWYPAFSSNGFFGIYLIENYIWDKPIYYNRAKTFQDLFFMVNEAVKIVRFMIGND